MRITFQNRRAGGGLVSHNCSFLNSLVTLAVSTGLVAFLTGTALTLPSPRHYDTGQAQQTPVWAEQVMPAPGGGRMTWCVDLCREIPPCLIQGRLCRSEGRQCSVWGPMGLLSDWPGSSEPCKAAWRVPRTEPYTLPGVTGVTAGPGKGNLVFWV